MQEEIKAWQHGYDLSYLKTMEKQWDHYNSFAASPFGKFKKNDIAKALHDVELVYNADYAYVFKHVKVDTPITLYNGVVGGYKRRGDVVVSKLLSYSGDFKTALNPFKGHNTWIYLWAEDRETRSKVEAEGWKWICGKVTTFGEIYAIYFRYSDSSFDGICDNISDYSCTNPVELITLKKTGNVNLEVIHSIKDTLNNLNLEYTNHYSNYNKDKSWKALSLRGYYADWTRIEKAEEMNKKWHEKHAHETPELQDTELYANFPMVKELLKATFGANAEIHRVRFMWLAPGGGELLRHTDQADPDCGLQIGQITRFHFPIQTNDKVIFTAFNLNGDKISLNLKEGEFGLLDTRKPHTVVNGGDVPRIHLVVDVKINYNVQSLILGNK